jgi:hypothetical protein
VLMMYGLCIPLYFYTLGDTRLSNDFESFLAGDYAAAGQDREERSHVRFAALARRALDFPRGGCNLF